MSRDPCRRRWLSHIKSMLILARQFPFSQFDPRATKWSGGREYWLWPATDGEREISVYVGCSALGDLLGVPASRDMLAEQHERIEMVARRKLAAAREATEVFLDTSDLRRPVSFFKVIGVRDADEETTLGPALRADEALATYNAAHTDSLDFACEDEGGSEFYLIEAEGVPMASGGWAPGRQLSRYALRHHHRH